MLLSQPSDLPDQASFDTWRSLIQRLSRNPFISQQLNANRYPRPPKHPKWPLSKTWPGYSLTWQMNKTKQDSSIAQLSVWDHISNVDVHIVCFNTPWRTHINTLTFHSCLIDTLQRQKEFPTLNHHKAVGLMLSRWKLNAKEQSIHEQSQREFKGVTGLVLRWMLGEPFSLAGLAAMWAML